MQRHIGRIAIQEARYSLYKKWAVEQSELRSNHYRRDELAQVCAQLPNLKLATVSVSECVRRWTKSLEDGIYAECSPRWPDWDFLQQNRHISTEFVKGFANLRELTLFVNADKYSENEGSGIHHGRRPLVLLT